VSRPLALSLLLALAACLARESRADEPGARPPPVEEPGLLRPPRRTEPTGLLGRKDRGPRMKLAYRTFSVGDQGDREARWHTLAVDRYFLSSLVRLGGGLEGGWESTPRSDFMLLTNLTVGLQYPCRLNPFLDSIYTFGLFRRDILHQDLYGFTYHIGLDAGVDFFVNPRFLLSAALGWRRVVFRQVSDDETESAYLYFDSFTVRIGLGF
jgi:hypothetical protein